MTWGAIEADGTATVANVESSGTPPRILEAFEVSAEALDDRPVVFGLPLGEIYIENVLLPALTARELHAAVEAQLEFHLPWDRSEALVATRTRRIGERHALLIVATRRRPRGRPVAVVPRHLALAALALMHDASLANGNVLLAHSAGRDMDTVMLVDGEITFLRTLVLGDDPAADLRLSAQEVYLREERRLVRPDRVVFLGSVPADRAIIGETLETEVESISVEELLGSPVVSWAELYCAGLGASMPLPRSLARWDMLQREDPWKERARLAAGRLAPILPFFLVALFFAQSLADDLQAGHLEAETEALRSGHDEVVELEQQVLEMEAFYERAGVQIASPQAWQQLIHALAEARPYDLWLTGLSGATGGAVLVSGRAARYTLVTRYLENLAALDRLGIPQLLFAQRGNDGVDFQITFKMNSEPRRGPIPESTSEVEAVPGAGDPAPDAIPGERP